MINFDKLSSFLDSPEGEEFTRKYFEKIAKGELILQSQLERFHKNYANRFEEIILKLKNKYNSKEYVLKWHNRGYEPPENLYYFLFSYAKKYGREPTEDEATLHGNMFTGDMAVVHGYIFNMMYGQGTALHIDKL